MKYVAGSLIVVILIVVALRIAGIETHLASLDRSVAALLESVGLL